MSGHRNGGGTLRIGATLLALLFLGTLGARADVVTLSAIKDNTLYEPIAPDAFADMSDGLGPTMFTGKVKDADADPGPGHGSRCGARCSSSTSPEASRRGRPSTAFQLTLYCDKVATERQFQRHAESPALGMGRGARRTRVTRSRAAASRRRRTTRRGGTRSTLTSAVGNARRRLQR